MQLFFLAFFITYYTKIQRFTYFFYILYKNTEICNCWIIDVAMETGVVTVMNSPFDFSGNVLGS